MSFSKDDKVVFKSLIKDVLMDMGIGQIGQQSAQDQVEVDSINQKIDSLSADLKASNVGQSQSQGEFAKNTNITDYKDEDAGENEARKTNLAKSGSHDTFDLANMTRNKKIDGDSYSAAMSMVQMAAGIIAQASAANYQNTLSNERYMTERSRQQELRHADIAVAGQWGDLDKVKEFMAVKTDSK